ncbi:MAG: salicylate synthase [Micromonosporaceae bacterium]
MLIASRLARSGLVDAYAVYERDGTWSFFGGIEGAVVLRRDTVTASWHGRVHHRYTTTDQPLRQVAGLLASGPYPDWRGYGWAAFELAYLLHHRPDLIAAAADEPLLYVALPSVEVTLRRDGAVLSGTDGQLIAQCADVIRDSATESDYWPKSLGVEDVDRIYLRMVAKSLGELRGRQLNKVILSRTLPIDFELDLPATYLLGRRGNTPARSFLVRLGDIEVAGFSPETVVEVDRSGRVSTQPLAGTRALTGRREEDHRLRLALLRDPKEIFEHAISVKLAYDELSGLCGQARVEDFMAVRERGTVQHLASRVSGRLTGGADAWDALGALFPAVTGSGSPKVKALEAIQRYESEPRGLYSGAVLTVDSTGAMDAALVLRAIYRRAGRSWLRAGAGIVEHSTPEREHEETCEKLRSVARYLVPAVSTLGQP